MKSLVKYKFIKPRQFVSIMLLSSILSSSSFVAIAAANAAPRNLPEQKCKLTSQRQGDPTTQLPRQVTDAVRQDVSQRENIPVSRLRVTALSQETWSDGCLGLAQADEFCTQALIEGWRVSVSDGRSTWVYRTDSLGILRREEPQTTSNIPATVSNAVLKQASQQSGLPVSTLRIVQVQRRQWSDSCLGLGSPEVLCAAVVVPGWLVRVQAGEQQLVYRTGDFGSQPVLDKTASSID